MNKYTGLTNVKSVDSAQQTKVGDSVLTEQTANQAMVGDSDSSEQTIQKNPLERISKGYDPIDKLLINHRFRLLPEPAVTVAINIPAMNNNVKSSDDSSSESSLDDSDNMKSDKEVECIENNSMENKEKEEKAVRSISRQLGSSLSLNDLEDKPVTKPVAIRSDEMEKDGMENVGMENVGEFITNLKWSSFNFGEHTAFTRPSKSKEFFEDGQIGFRELPVKLEANKGGWNVKDQNYYPYARSDNEDEDGRNCSVSSFGNTTRESSTTRNSSVHFGAHSSRSTTPARFPDKLNNLAAALAYNKKNKGNTEANINYVKLGGNRLWIKSIRGKRALSVTNLVNDPNGHTHGSFHCRGGCGGNCTCQTRQNKKRKIDCRDKIVIVQVNDGRRNTRSGDNAITNNELSSNSVVICSLCELNDISYACPNCIKNKTRKDWDLGNNICRNPNCIEDSEIREKCTKCLHTSCLKNSCPSNSICPPIGNSNRFLECDTSSCGHAKNEAKITPKFEFSVKEAMFDQENLNKKLFTDKLLISNFFIVAFDGLKRIIGSVKDWRRECDHVEHTVNPEEKNFLEMAKLWVNVAFQHGQFTTDFTLFPDYYNVEGENTYNYEFDIIFRSIVVSSMSDNGNNFCGKENCRFGINCLSGVHPIGNWKFYDKYKGFDLEISDEDIENWILTPEVAYTDIRDILLPIDKSIIEKIEKEDEEIAIYVREQAQIFNSLISRRIRAKNEGTDEGRRKIKGELKDSIINILASKIPNRLLHFRKEKFHSDEDNENFIFTPQEFPPLPQQGNAKKRRR